MFDLSWGEMGIIALVALIVLGPKELPNALRTVSMLMKNARKLAGEFQSGVNEIVREADLEDARKKLMEVQSLNKNQIKSAIEKAVDPTGEVKTALTIETDPTGPARTEVKAEETTPAIGAAAAQDSLGTVQSGEDDAVEIAAAEVAAPAASDPDVTPAPEPVPGAQETRETAMTEKT
jgi:sec-independent protein translocase protein TatB